MNSIHSLERKYQTVDVFSDNAGEGNPVAVVLADSDLSATRMQQIAKWLNLSETVFITEVIDNRQYRARIFTPNSELPFAGHPSLGSAYAMLEWNLLDRQASRLQLHCGLGQVTLENRSLTETPRLRLQAPSYSVSCISQEGGNLLRQCLPGIELRWPPLILDVGPRWLVCQVSHNQAHLYKLQKQALLNLSQLEQLTGMCLFAVKPGPAATVYTRSFAPLSGVDEDPVCGSGNISVAAYLMETDQLAETGQQYTAYQGHELGRNGKLFMSCDPQSKQIYLGGNCVSVINGSIRC